MIYAHLTPQHIEDSVGRLPWNDKADKNNQANEIDLKSNPESLLSINEYELYCGL